MCEMLKVNGYTSEVSVVSVVSVVPAVSVVPVVSERLFQNFECLPILWRFGKRSGYEQVLVTDLGASSLMPRKLAVPSGRSDHLHHVESHRAHEKLDWR